MITFFWLIIGVMMGGAGMLYSHKSKIHKRLAVMLFAVAALGSIVLGIKAIADGNPAITNAPSSNVTISSNSAPVSQGNTTITSTNQSGGFNGVNNGGTVNVGAPARKLSDEQLADIKEAVKLFLNDGPVRLGTEGGNESIRLASQLAPILNIKPDDISRGLGFGGGVSEGIEIDVRDAHPPPPLATALAIHLQRAGLTHVFITERPAWPASDENTVYIFILPNPEPTP